MRYVNLMDHYHAVNDGPNLRNALKSAIAQCKSSKTRKLYVPWELSSIPVKLDEFVDKQTAFDPINGEPGDWAFLRLYVDTDLEIYGDGPDASVLNFDATTNWKFAAFKLRTPFDLMFRDIGITTSRHHGTLVDSQTKGSYGLYVPGRVQASAVSLVRTENVKWDWFTAGMFIDSNGDHTVGLELIRSDFSAQLVGVACYSSATPDSKSVHVEHCTFRNTDRLSGWGSHLFYLHPMVAARFLHTTFRDWGAAEYAVQWWGSASVHNRPKYCVFDNCVWDSSGLGYAGIFSDEGSTQVRGGVMACRTGFQGRGDVQISGLQVIANKSDITPGSGMFIAPWSTGKKTKIQITDVRIDVTNAPPLYKVFDLGGGDGVWNLADVDIVSRGRTSNVQAFGAGYRTPGSSHVVVRARNVRFNGYQCTPEEWAVGANRSSIAWLVAKQGDYEFVDCEANGSGVNDGGFVHMADGTGQVGDVLKADFVNFKASNGGHGAVVKVDQHYDGKIRGTIIHADKVVLLGGAKQRLILPAGAAQGILASSQIAISTATNIADVSCPTQAIIDPETQQTTQIPVATTISVIYVNGQANDTAAYVGSTWRARCRGPLMFAAGGNIDASPQWRDAGEVVTFLLNEDLVWEEVGTR